MTQWQAYLLSLFIEVPVVVLLFNTVGAHPLKSMAAAIIATSLTHPLAWYTASLLPAQDYNWHILGIEGVVIAVETIPLKWIAQVTWRLALLGSLVANLASTLVGYFFSAVYLTI